MPVIKSPDIPEIIDPKQVSVFDPLYQVLLRKAATFTGMNDPQSMVMQGATPTPLVAGVPPEEIGALRQAGKDLLEKIRAHGLEKRSLGQIPLTSEGFQRVYGKEGAKLGVKAQPSDYAPNIPVPPDVMEALTYAQQKYPRIFGHVKDIADVDAMQQVRSWGGTRGTQQVNKVYNRTTKTMDPTKFSKLGLNVSGLESARANPFTVGHELLHATDAIVNPNVGAAYKASMELPGGYEGSAYEARANVQGERFVNKMNGTPNPKPVSLSGLENAMLERYRVAPPPPTIPPTPVAPPPPEPPISFMDYIRKRMGQ